MRKQLSVWGGAFFLILLFFAVCSAQTLTIGSATGYQKDSVTLSLTFEPGDEDVVTMVFDVLYETQNLTFTQAALGGGLSGNIFDYNEVSPGVVRFAITSPVSPLTPFSSGEIATLTFEVTGTTGVTMLTLDNVGLGGMSGGNVPVSGTNPGTVSLDVVDQCLEDPYKVEPGDCGCGFPDLDKDGNGVSDCLEAVKGDVDTNGTIDINDALMISLFDVKIITQAEVPGFSQADVNCDGKVNIEDALKIADFVVKTVYDLSCP